MVDGKLVIAVKDIEATSGAHGKLKCLMMLKGVYTLELDDGRTWEIRIESDIFPGGVASNVPTHIPTIDTAAGAPEQWVPYTFTYKQIK